MTSPRPVRVAIDARMPSGQWGGVQQLVEGLASGLGRLEGEDEFLFLGYADAAEWLDPLLAGSCRRIEVPAAFGRSGRRRLYDSVARRLPRLARVAGAVAAPFGSSAMPLPVSDGVVESLGVDVIHFATPQAYRTAVPSIYQPLDLLHVHVPESFSAAHRRYRERAYRAFCEQAALVIALSQWGRADLVEHFGLDRDRVAVVPLPPVVRSGRGFDGEASTDLRLPDRFLLYPAQTWPHKNHLRLLDALALLRERDSPVEVVCTGRKTDHFAAIERRIAELRLDGQIHFVGYVTEPALADAYRRATAVIFPSRFEGWGLPVVEAFDWGVAVGCSDIPVLREVAGDAAIYWDPDDAEGMAAGITRLWSEEPLRQALRAAGRERVAGMSWDRTGATYRALYRHVAGAGLTEADRAHLAHPTFA